MPRGGPPSYSYSVPAGTQAVSGQVISSAAYNGLLTDLATTFNTAWPDNLLNIATAASPTTIAYRDTNGNLSTVNFLPGFNTTATAAGTTTLTVASAGTQAFTGVTTQTLKMPVVSTLVRGQSWIVLNGSTGVVTITSSGSNTITTLAANGRAVITCIATTGTDATSWFAGKSYNLELPVSVANGGTGDQTLTANAVLIGNGTSAVTGVAPGTSGNLLTSNGTSWASTAPILTSTSTSKTTGTTSSTSGTLANVTNGALAILASKTYFFQFSGQVNTGSQSTRGFQFAVTVPSGAAVSVTGIAVSTAITVQGFTTTSGGVVLTENGASDANTSWSFTITGTVVVSSTAGNIQLQFAQVSANANASTITTGMVGSAVAVA